MIQRFKDFSNKVKLTNEQSELIDSLPEHGMGYHVVDIKLKNGDILKDMIVINSTHIQTKNESFNVNDIESIIPHE